jgi:hypothetical protein
MKKFAYIIIAAIAAALAVSCAKELGAPAEDGDMVTFTASMPQTKTDIVDGHTVWSITDKIKVYYGESSAVAKLKTGENTANATFEAQVPESNDYYAVYPAEVTSSKPAADLIKVTIPQSQEGSFGSGHIAVAKGANKAFAFSNVNSFLKIGLPEAGYTKIVVESPSGQPLSGEVSVSFTGGNVQQSLGSALNPSVEISSSAGFPAGNVFVSIIAGVTHEKGLLLKYYDASGLKGSYYLDKELTTKASTIHSFGEFGVTGEYFATLEGAGNKIGINQANAMDLAGLKALLTKPEDDGKLAAWAAGLDGATIHLGEGTWDFQDSLLIAFPGVGAPVSVTFEGNNTVITGADLHRLLNIGENTNVTFKDISFANGLANASRNSPILINGEAKASFYNCTFKNCANIKDDGSYGTGGCLYAEEGTVLYFENCEFAFNKGSYGANLLTLGKADIKDSHFHDNDGTWPGSAIYLDHGDADVNVINTIFEDNTVTKEEGKKPDGGAIVVIHGKLTMTDCSLLRNSIPTRRGGALRVQNSDGYAKLINCTVKENFSDWGGALNVVDGALLEIQGGLYQENYSKGGGCILASSNGNIRIADALFKDNYVNKNGRHGGAIRFESNGELTILRTTFEGNHSDYNGEEEAFGGAVSVDWGQNSAEVTIDGCTFIGNHSKSGGGAALSYQSGGDPGTGWLKVSNTRFEGNYNEYQGNNNSNYARHAGAVRLGHDITNSYFDNCVFVNNYTMTASEEVKSAYGGAVTFYADGNGYFNNCHFENNRATRGGAISVWNCVVSGIYLNGCSFTGNWISYKNGTSIFIEKAKHFAMNNCSFNDDTYTMSNGEDDGCWVYVNGDTDKLLEECVISNCTLIGSARTTSALDPLADQELVYIKNAKSGKDYHLLNNIILAGNDQYSWWINQSGTSNTYGYYNVFTKKGGTSPYNGSGDTEGKSKADLGSLSWDAASHVWSWNGTVAGSSAKISASAFATAMNSASPTFKAWLESIDALDKDQLGNARGNGEWWPGAYQK